MHSFPSAPDAHSPAPHRPLGRRIRVLHLIGLLYDSGGAERFVTGLVTHLPADRFETWVCAPRGAAPEAAAKLRAAGVGLLTLGRERKRDAHRLRGLVGLIRRERFDIIHSHMFGSNLWATTLGRACGIPVVLAQEHTWSYEGNRLRVLLDGQLIGRLATRFIAVSRADAEKMVSVEQVPRDKVVVIPTAYVPHASGSDGDIRRELGLTETTPLIGTAAVMRPQKRLDLLIEAHALIRSQIPDAHLVIAGRGPCEAELLALTARLGMSDHVHFLGLRTDIDRLLPRLDVAAMSSNFEGMPLFAFECMASHTPLVATAVGALPDVIEDGTSGLLVPPGSPPALAEAIVGLLRDPDRRRALADNGAARLPDYTLERITERVASLYEDLLHERLATAGNGGRG